MTYDREVIKLDVAETAKWHKALFGPPPEYPRTRAHLARRRPRSGGTRPRSPPTAGRSRTSMTRKWNEGRRRLRHEGHAGGGRPHRVEDRRHLASPRVRAEGVADGRGDASHPPRRGRGGLHQRRAGGEGERATPPDYVEVPLTAPRPQGAQGRQEHDRGPLPPDGRRAVHRRGVGGGGGTKCHSLRE